jgi:Regulator of chromosome condensation (RCC1) repeat
MMPIVRPSRQVLLPLLLAVGASGCTVSTESASPDEHTETSMSALIPRLRVRAVEIAVSSDDNGCVLLSDGVVECWTGGDPTGIGSPTTTPYALTEVALETSATSVSAGDGYACAVLSDHTVWCWGSNTWILATVTTTPVQIMVGTAPLYATSLSAGDSTACVVTTAGGAACWGWGGIGQLGFLAPSSEYVSTTAVDVAGLSGVVAVAVGGEHACAILSGGVVDCWGADYFGQLGNLKTVSNQSAGTLPGRVELLPPATAISAGESDTCAITSAGEYCWGENYNGQAGVGTYGQNYPYYSYPVPVSLSSTPTSISAASWANCEVVNGVGYCQGYDYNDALGADQGTNVLPIPVIGTGSSGPIAQIAEGSASTCALTTGGVVECLGFGSTAITTVF